MKLAWVIPFLFFSGNTTAAEFLGSNGIRYFFDLGDEIFMCWFIGNGRANVRCVGKDKKRNIGIKYICKAVPIDQGALTNCTVVDFNTMSV